MKNLKNSVLYILVIVVAVIVSISVFAGSYSYVSVNLSERAAEKILDRFSEFEKYNEELKKTRIEILKLREEQNLKDTIKFLETFEDYKGEYDKKVFSFADKINQEPASVRDLKETTINLKKAAEQFKYKLTLFNFIPEEVRNFYNLNVDFLDNTVKMLEAIIGYYDNSEYSNYNNESLKKIVTDNLQLRGLVEKERERIYKEFDLEYLLDR